MSSSTPGLTDSGTLLSVTGGFKLPTAGQLDFNISVRDVGLKLINRMDNCRLGPSCNNLHMESPRPCSRAYG